MVHFHQLRWESLKEEEDTSALCFLGCGLQTTWEPGTKPNWPWYASEWKRLCANQGEFFQHLRDWCQGVSIWKPQLCARSLLGKADLGAKCSEPSEEEAGARTWGLYSGMFKKADSSFPCQKEREKEKGHSEEHSLKQVAPGFQGIGRADATRL